MSLPMPPVAALPAVMNPIEIFISGFNTNTYFIGFMMLLLNLGGRHLSSGLTPEQDKIFQHTWVRRALLFVVIFVATRNMFTALWMSIGIIITIGYLTNETSDLYLFGKPKKADATPAQGLSVDEQEMYRRLHERVTKQETEKMGLKPEGFEQSFIGNYQNSMRVITAA
jgi:hypothetical protein